MMGLLSDEKRASIRALIEEFFREKSFLEPRMVIKAPKEKGFSLWHGCVEAITTGNCRILHYLPVSDSEYITHPCLCKDKESRKLDRVIEEINKVASRYGYVAELGSCPYNDQCPYGLQCWAFWLFTTKKE